MGLLQKMFSKKEEQNDLVISKSEIFIYGRGESDLRVEEDKNYFIIGYFNEDRTIFTDIANDKVYKMEKPYCGTLEINFEGIKMNAVGSGASYEREKRYIGHAILKPNTHIEDKNFQWLKEIVVGRSYYSPTVNEWICTAESRDMRKFLDFLLKHTFAEVKASELKLIAKGLNNYAYDCAVKLEKGKSI